MARDFGSRLWFGKRKPEPAGPVGRGRDAGRHRRGSPREELARREHARSGVTPEAHPRSDRPDPFELERTVYAQRGRGRHRTEAGAKPARIELERRAKESGTSGRLAFADFLPGKGRGRGRAERPASPLPGSGTSSAIGKVPSTGRLFAGGER